MPENTTKAALTLVGKAGVRPAKHGLYSWIDSKRIPRGRAFQAIRRELAAVRSELIEVRGGDARVSAEQKILIDSIVEALGVQKLLGLYVRKCGVIDGQAAKRGSLELSPILAKNWVSYGNVVRQAILALKELDARRPGENAPTLAEIIAECDAEEAKAQERAAGGAGVAQDGQSPEGQDTDKRDAPSGGEILNARP